MRYTRKNISQLLDTVQGSPDVTGFWTSTFGGYTYTVTPSAGGYLFQDVNWAGRKTCEDGSQVVYEDAQSIGCR